MSTDINAKIHFALKNPLILKCVPNYRVYILLIADGNDWLYLFRKGYARFAKKRYDKKSFELLSHTTHTRVENEDNILEETRE